MDQQILEELYYKMYQGMIDKDIDYLATIHHPSFTLRHMTGMTQDREHYFQDIINDQLGYRAVTHDQVQIRQSGNLARMVGHSRVRAAVYGGMEHTWKLELIFGCQKIDGHWMLMYCVASTY